MDPWTLPQTVLIGGRTYAIHADFRDILQIIAELTNESVPEPLRWEIAGCLFCDDFDALCDADKTELLRALARFINCGKDEADTPPRPKTIDWQQDQPLIVADVNRVAGQEIRALPFVHWWTFMAWFNAVGDGALATVVSLREKLRRGIKLERWERDFYNENRKLVDFQTRYTAAEDDLLRQWTGR